MTTAAFASLVPLPVIITAPGKYRTRAGELVTITDASPRHDFRCLGRYSCGTTEGWHNSGRLYFNLECDNDIVSAA